MTGQILKFVKLFKEQRIKLPKALSLLEKVRADHKLQRKDMEWLQNASMKHQGEIFNIKALIKNFEQKRYKSKLI